LDTSWTLGHLDTWTVINIDEQNQPTTRVQ
jgi:hypothetical protein